MPRKPIYVEIMIRTDIETLWKYTQDPVLHVLLHLPIFGNSILAKECGIGTPAV